MLSAGQRPSRQWQFLGLAIAAAVMVLGAVFWREVAGAWRVWLASPTYNHCFLVLPIALYLIWDRRHLLANLTPRPDFRALALLPLLSAAWLMAAVLGVLELQQLLLLTMLQALLLAALGWRLYGRMLGPLLYLYLLVPSGEFLVPHLQDVTARFAVDMLRLFHVPVYSDGIMISIPEGDFIVAEACAGLRFLIASIAFGAFFALMVYRSWWKRAAFLAASLIVPVFANGIRAFGIIYLAHLTDDVVAVEADHIIYGWGFFTAVLLVLIAIGMRFADKRAPAPAPEIPMRPTPAAVRAPVVAVAIGLLLAALGPAYLSLLDNSAPLDLSQVPPPGVAVPWQPRATTDSWNPVIVAPDRQFRDSFDANGIVVERYVALYDTHGRHNNLVRSQNRVVDDDVWVRSVFSAQDVAIGGRTVRVAAAELHSGDQTRLLWYFYVVDGEITASPAEAKLRQARSILEGRSSVGAFIAVATSKQPGVPAAENLARFLGAMQSPVAYIAAVKRAARDVAPAPHVALRSVGAPPS